MTRRSRRSRSRVGASTTIDISEKAVKESKLSAEEYFAQHVRSVIEKHGENSLIAFDDFLDAAGGIERLYNSSLRVEHPPNHLAEPGGED